MSKKKQSKSGSSKKRTRKGRAASGGRGPGQSAGLMTSMVAGFRRAVGTDDAAAHPEKKTNPLWTALLIAAVLAFAFWQFAR